MDHRPPMTDAPVGGWQCPSCGRYIPRTVEVCRCGRERRRLEALGYTFDTAPPLERPAALPPRPEYHGPAATLTGYRIDAELGAGWRALLKGLFGVAVMAVLASGVLYTHRDLPATRENVHVLTTLEAYTRGAGPDAGNTIPGFLGSAGMAGALAPTGTSDDPVRAIDETQLREGFCSRSIARQVRYEYPGYYEGWPDDRLERSVLEKHPEYANRVCSLSSRLDATPGDIIKYELKSRSLLGTAGLWLGTLLVTTLFAAACLNLYYRVIVGRFASAL